MKEHLILLCRAMKEDNPTLIEGCFNNLARDLELTGQRKTDLSNITKRLGYLYTKYKEDLPASVSTFFPEIQNAPSADEIKASSRNLMVLQEKLIKWLNFAFHEMGQDFQDIIKKQETAVAAFSNGAKKNPLYKRLFSNSVFVNVDVLRITQQFCVYTALRRDKIRNATYHALDRFDSESLSYPLEAKKNLIEKLLKTRNPYAEECEKFLQAYLDMHCIGTSTHCDRESVDRKIRYIFRNRLFITSKLYDNLIDLCREQDITIKRFNGICISAIKATITPDSKDSGSSSYPDFNTVKELFRTAIHDMVEAEYDNLSSGYKRLNEYIKRSYEENSQLKKMILRIHELLVKSLSNEDAEQQAYIILPRVKQSLYSGLSEKYYPTGKEVFLKENFKYQEALFGSKEWAESFNGSSFDRLQEIITRVQDYRNCDDLLFLLSPLLRQMLHVVITTKCRNDY